MSIQSGRVSDDMIYDCGACGYTPQLGQIPQTSANHRRCPSCGKGKMTWRKRPSPIVYQDGSGDIDPEIVEYGERFVAAIDEMQTLIADRDRFRSLYNPTERIRLDAERAVQIAALHLRDAGRLFFKNVIS